jgi:membrane protease YdiL (CAAX protease family)
MLNYQADSEPGMEHDRAESETRAEAQSLHCEGQWNASLRKVFIGPNGLRAGWRLLIFIFMAVVVWSFLRGILPGVAPRPTPWSVIQGEGVGFFSLALAAAVMARIEKRSFADYALPLRSAFGARFWFGALWGFVALSALLLAIRAERGFSFGAVALEGRRLATYAALWAIAFVFVALLEEFLMRGYALYTLTTGMGFWPSAVLLSIIFGAGHLRNPQESWAGGLAAALMGLFFCFTVRRTGDLWFAIGLHAMWDYSESFLYSVPDSGVVVEGHLLNSSFHGPAWLTGGSVGPEGSALVFVVIGVMFVIFSRLYPRSRFPSSVRSSLPAPNAAASDE